MAGGHRAPGLTEGATSCLDFRAQGIVERLPPPPAGPSPRTLLSFPTENLFSEPSADLSEIDARLQALQEYMNKLETRT